MVTKSHPLGSTPLPKVSERIDHGTKFADVAPYIEDRKMHAQATVVIIFFLFFILFYYLSGQKLIILKMLS